MNTVKQWLAQRNGNRRDEQRIQWFQEIRYRLDQGPFQRARVEDVSRGGLRLVLPKALPNGARVQVLYKNPDSTSQHWVEGKVCWVQERASAYLIGLEIEHCSAVDQGPFERLLDRLQVA